jgi:hypothetical protein
MLGYAGIAFFHGSLDLSFFHCHCNPTVYEQ